MEQIGESHGFGSGDGDAERCVDRLKLCEGKEAKAAQAEMALGGHDADIFPPEIGLRVRDGEQLDKPFRRARRMKADDGQVCRRVCWHHRDGPIRLRCAVPNDRQIDG